MDNHNYNKPLISIITVCFNSAKTIRQTIESVLNQTYTKIEYILIDGKSTDNTVVIIEEYAPLFAAKGIAYRWVSEPDNGIYDAMNKGIKLATGEWINIQGSDDWLNTSGVEIFVNLLNNTSKSDIYWFGASILIGQDVLINYPKIDNIKKYKMIGCHQAVFVTRQLMSSGFNLSYKLAADFEFILRSYIGGANIITSDQVIANYSYGGASNANQLVTIREYQSIANQLLKNNSLRIWVHFNLLILRVLIVNNLKKIVSQDLYVKIKRNKC